MAVVIEYELPVNATECQRRQASAREPRALSGEERQVLRQSLRELLKTNDAVMVSHFYVDADLQDLAEETGGLVSDSLEMARFGRDHHATTLLVSGVRFMGETAKILSPYKRVLMPDPEATCSLDLACPPDEFSAFCDAHPDRTVVVYANTSADVKARADWVVTSSCAIPIVQMLAGQGHKILWAPDRHLGAYIQKQTGADILIWPGACVVHHEFSAKGIAELKQRLSDVVVLAHPESPQAVLDLANVVGSTTAILNAASAMSATNFIVATDGGLMHPLRKLNPGKTFHEAPTTGSGHCAWMAMNTLEGAVRALTNGGHEILVDAVSVDRARRPIDRMLAATSQAAAHTK